MLLDWWKSVKLKGGGGGSCIKKENGKSYGLRTFFKNLFTGIAKVCSAYNHLTTLKDIYGLYM